jgi:biopolymer transport protein TolR
MAVVVDGGAGDRKKPLSAELNLVPYIDLLTCMVAFLLITAVWTQLARLEVQQKGQGEVDSPAVVDQWRVAVAVHEGGFNLISADPIVFDTLVKTMDAVMSAGFPAVSLLDAASG